MYEFVGHPSEEMIRVTAQTMEEVFVDAASALFELMTDTGKLKAEQRFPVHLSAPDRILLLIDWLNRLIYLHEVENVFLCKFDVSIQTGSQWSLNAVVYGETITDGMERRLHAKSATYGQIQWHETPQGHQVQFVIDV